MRRRLLLLFAVLATAWITVPTHSPASEIERPGTERWAVKIGADADAGRVKTIHNNPKGELGRLVRLPRPASFPEDGRRSAELGIYTVSATVTQFKLEKDGDYHVVLRDGGQTMIAEIPEPAFCRKSRWAPQIAEARHEFNARYRVSDRFRYVNAPALLTGVLFFDFQHGQTGVAPNAVEMHPVLSITWAGTAKGRQPALLSPRHHSARATRRRHAPRSQRPAASSGVMVWVNTNTGVYHYPGTRWYENTKDGKLIPESQARAEGDRPAENGQ